MNYNSALFGWSNGPFVHHITLYDMMSIHEKRMLKTTNKIVVFRIVYWYSPGLLCVLVDVSRIVVYFGGRLSNIQIVPRKYINYAYVVIGSCYHCLKNPAHKFNTTLARGERPWHCSLQWVVVSKGLAIDLFTWTETGYSLLKPMPGQCFCADIRQAAHWRPITIY